MDFPVYFQNVIWLGGWGGGGDKFIHKTISEKAKHP
jgi:hypothetical protein